jgi:hypothetical protein
MRLGTTLTLGFLAMAHPAIAAATLPTDVQLPGTQPGEAKGIESVSKCDNCHGHYASQEEPWFQWAGGMMAHASRDPLFWAAVAIAEQSFQGAGDLCIRCHVPEGWLGGRSIPTDGSALRASDADGVQCDVCHRLTNPDGSEHVGEQNAPFLAHDGGLPPTGYYGSGQYVIWNGNSKLGPYAETSARHQFRQSHFHRSSDLCGTCHDVSNPVVGDLAPGHGAQTPLAPGSFSGVPGAPVEEKAAFNNFPHQYGVVERTYSEHKASRLAETRVSDYLTLPPELQAGSIRQAYEAALVAGKGGDYEDGTTRLFTCQSCHMRPTVGQGCDKNPPVRADLPLHDLTGGNTWVPDAMQWLDARGLLLLGGGLSAAQRSALEAGKQRARSNLEEAASLSVHGNVVRVVNLTGHKLISGYPEGRRMWLRIHWYGSADQLLADDGAYGTLEVDVRGVPTLVETLLDLSPPYTPVYEAHAGITQAWASRLLELGLPPELPIGFDRVSGAVTGTLGELAAQAPGTARKSFHFVLNDTLLKDNRIPPWGMGREAAVERNLVPVPASQYGNPGPGGEYEHWSDVVLNPPPGARRATVQLLYQSTSWEYIQFLALANRKENAFLAQEGERLLDAWLATGMAAPEVMATAEWQDLVPACSDGLDNDGDGLIDYPDDPGCSSPMDDSENDPSLPCDDRIDNDGDGLVDFPRDPGCQQPLSPKEDPECDDGIDNDGDGFIDWDGGGVGDPDPQCIGRPWHDREAAPRRRCGLGAELVLVLALFVMVRHRVVAVRRARSAL